MNKYKIAIAHGIVSAPGNKPDFGPPGAKRETLTPKQRKTRSVLTYQFVNCELSAAQIGEAINRGYTITGQHTAPRKNANFKVVQHLGGDFDQLKNEHEILDHALVKAYGSIIYHTTSSTPQKPKMRVIFLLDQPVDDPALYKQMLKAMLWKFENLGDEACKDLCRLFYGRLGTGPTVTDKVLPLEIALQWVAEWVAANPQKASKSRQSTGEANSKRGQNQAGATDHGAQYKGKSTAYGRQALKNACSELVKINTPGMYYTPLNKAAFCLGQLVAGGEINRLEVEQALSRATADWPAGAGGPDRTYTIKKALDDGALDPRSAPEREQAAKADPLGSVKVDQVISARFLPDITLNKKITLIRSPKNTGKTEAMKRLVSIVPANATVMAIGHRQALLAELARRWGLEFYQDYKGITVDRKGLTKSNRLAICADSLTHLNSATGRTYIILDEVEQVLKHLTGSTIKKNRRGVLAMFEALLKLADHIIALDADLGSITYRYFERLLGAENIEVLVNEYVPEKAIPMLQYDNQNEITAALFEKLKAGIRPAIFTNNKAEAQRLERVISKDFPELKVLCVHQDNSAAPTIRQAIANLNLYATEYDVLIASPSLGTGVDINVRHFTETFLLGNHHSTNHTDLLQHMARNRQPDLIHAYVAPGERYEPTDPAFWEKQCVDKYYETGLQIEYSLETGERIANPFDIGYLKLWADIKAAEKASHNRLAANFYEQAAREGYQVQPARPAQEELHNNVMMSNEGSEAVEAGKKRAAASHELEQERKEAILAAPEISDKEAVELEAKAYLPKPQRAKLEKHRIKSFYNLPVDAPLVEIDNKGRTMGRLNEFMMYTGQIDSVERDRTEMDDRENMVPDSRHYTLRKNLRVEALAAAGFSLESNFTPEALAAAGFVEWGLANKDRIYSVLGITVKSDFEKRPVELLSAIFHQIGIKLQSRQLGKRSEQKRIYSIDRESAKLMWRLAKARAEGLKVHSSRVELAA